MLNDFDCLMILREMHLSMAERESWNSEISKQLLKASQEQLDQFHLYMPVSLRLKILGWFIFFNATPDFPMKDNDKIMNAIISPDNGARGP